MFAPFECARDERMHGGDFLSGPPARLGFLRRLSPDPGRQYRSRGMNWANRTVFTGDNLDVLRGMDSATVDLIYADPPFNSNRNYAAPIGSKAAGAAFKDTWTLDDIDEAWLSIIHDQHPAPHAVIEAAGVAHGDGMKSYLCMMAIRLIELRRVLAPTGSIYLHCDPTASHYLKLLMDAIFGTTNFRNEITWQRTVSHNTAQRYGNVADIILYYTTDDGTWNQQYQEYGETQRARFRHKAADGRLYKLDDLTASRAGSESGKFEWRGTRPPPTRGWGYTLEQLEKWWQEGRIQIKRDGTPRMDGLKVYLDEAKGKPLINVWTDVPRIPNTSAERTGYPTQKPLALLNRIIAASSNPDDVVLDPFCGCATALVSAENLTRQWLGIDISPLAVKLVRQRLAREVPLFTQDAIERTDVPIRTDLVDEVREYLNEKRALYGQQEGICAGCRVHFELRNMEVDHVIPRVKGGPNHISNYQLLCGSCNRRKGAGSQAELIAKLKRDGIIAA